jgi:putative transposase
MAKPLRTAIAGTFFITTNTHQRRRTFQVERNAELFHETLRRYRAEGLYKLHAFVIMPDHVHLLLTTEDLPGAMQRIKGAFSRRLGSKFPVWQHGYTDHLVETREEFESLRDYIHNNPVHARLVERPEDYGFSSAHRD